MREMISLARVYYPVKVLGPGSRVGIWLNGCHRKCPGCISPELQGYDPAKEVSVQDVIKMIMRIDSPIDGFTISGGEPFYNPKALNALVSALATICDDILIFTGYTLEELRQQDNEAIYSILNTCSAIIDAKDDAVLDHTVGQIYSVDGHPLCDVFIGNDGSGIMFEPVGESKEGSLEKRRQIESSANSICSLYGKLEEKAAEKGVILKRVYIEPAHIEQMCVQSDISERSARKKQRKTTVQKQKAMGTEG